MKILTRYVIREHLAPLTFAASTLTALMVLNAVAKQFGQLVGKGLSWGVIAEFFYLSVPYIVALTMPMAVLVAVLYAFSRMAAENEVTALRATGVSVVRLVRPVMAGGAVLAVIMLVFNDQVLPRSNHRLRTLQSDIARKKPTFALREQVINEVIPGKIFLKAGHIDEATNKLREVFIYNFEDPMHQKTIYADSGVMGLTSDESTLQMTLQHGYVLQVPRDDPTTLQRLNFTTDLVRVRGVANRFEKTEKDNYKSEREMTICEMNTQYQSGAHQLDAARSSLADLLGNAATYAATGIAPPLPTTAAAPAAPHDHTTSGSVYCHFISKLLGAGIASAEAAELPRQPVQQPRQQPRKQTAQSKHPAPPTARKIPELMRPPASRPLAPGAHPAPIFRGGMPVSSIAPALMSPTSVMGEIEISRARLLGARSTMSLYEVEIQKMFALAAACVVFVLFGAPLALRFPRGGVGLVIGVSIVAFAIYYVCLIGGEALATKLLMSPFWAMWAANALFTIAGIVLLIRVQHSGATMRGDDLSAFWEGLRMRFARHLRRTGIMARRREREAT